MEWSKTLRISGVNALKSEHKEGLFCETANNQMEALSEKRLF